ncbi:MAG: WecB/TagA/CpsF family glycosyltransferase [Candidatus Woesebacteria bacterium]|nr:WecB/TagA/CpsF family glycosyltransferase [Candidatus Woesebacteria bacterium]
MLKKQKKVLKSSRNHVNILGVRLDSTSQARVLALLEDFIVRGQKFSVFTANPELLVMAAKDQNLKEIVNSADLVIPDGIGLKYAAKFLHRTDLNVIPGRKLFLKLLALARKNNWKVFFLGGKGIKNVTAGSVLDENGEPKTAKEAKIQKEVIQKISEIKPDLLFVGFGMPKQEKWIFKNLPRLAVGGAIAVGGTFNYVFGPAKLPPVWMEKGGLEWLWRLLHEPKRVLRILNAVIIFPLKVFWYKFH